MARISSEIKIFKAVDELMFKLVDEFLALAPVRKIQDELEALPEQQQKIINKILCFIFILLPFIFVISMFFTNQSIRNTNQVRSEVLQYFVLNSSQSSQLGSIGQGLIGPTILDSSESFQQIVRSIQSSRSINSNSVNISHFENFPVGSELQQSIIGLSFSELTTQDLTTLISDLIQRQRVKIKAVEIEKNQTTSFLQGSLEIISFSRVNL
jgi:hypothetical protein